MIALPAVATFIGINPFSLAADQNKMTPPVSSGKMRTPSFASRGWMGDSPEGGLRDPSKRQAFRADNRNFQTPSSTTFPLVVSGVLGRKTGVWLEMCAPTTVWRWGSRKIEDYGS